MQASYPFEFEREMGCTADELRTWLPGGSAGRAITWRARGADVVLDEGSVAIDWHQLEPRHIALITLPRLHVKFSATGVAAPAWHAFMKHFDLYTQRGGG